VRFDDIQAGPEVSTATGFWAPASRSHWHGRGIIRLRGRFGSRSGCDGLGADRVFAGDQHVKVGTGEDRHSLSDAFEYDQQRLTMIGRRDEIELVGFAA